MNSSEKTVFAMLGASIAAGLFHLGTSPLWSKEETDQSKKSENSSNEKEPVYYFKI